MNDFRSIIQLRSEEQLRLVLRVLAHSEAAGLWQLPADVWRPFTGQPAYPSIEVDGPIYKAFINAHPRRDRLRKHQTTMPPAGVYVYDLDRYGADRRLRKQPMEHAVAFRSDDGAKTLMRYFIYPNGLMLLDGQVTAGRH